MPSLQDAINAAGGPLALLRSGSGGFPLPIKPEFTNWRDEQESWRTTAALMDLSHHMNDLTVQGPDAGRLLADLGANSFKGFGPMKAKQFVTVSYDGYVIGDCILCCLAENLVRLVGRPPRSYRNDLAAPLAVPGSGRHFSTRTSPGATRSVPSKN